MQLSDLQNIFEVQSIDNLIKKELDLIADEEKRIEHVRNLNEVAKESLEDLKSNLEKNHIERKRFENELFEVDKKLEQTQSHISNATSENQVVALEKELTHLVPQKEDLESQILELLESEESLLEEIQKKEEFIHGSNETLKEIIQEVEEFKDEKNKVINSYEERIKNLIEITDSGLSNIFLKTREKLRFVEPISLLTNKSCGKCKFQMDSVSISKIETLKDVDLCPSCSRIVVSPEIRSIK